MENQWIDLYYKQKLLQLEGIRTVAPLGEWSDWVFSEELKTYSELGAYQFEVLKGYTFGKKDLLKDYVSEMYKIKENTSRDNPMYLISKLLMNSLYGRFGMNPELKVHEIIRDSEIDSFISKYDGISIEPFNNGLTLVSYFKPKSDDLHNWYDEERVPNVNVAIAASITS